MTTNEIKHVDMFGRDIKVGDYIVYAAQDCDSATLRAGQVLELKVVEDQRSKEKTPKVFCKSWSLMKGGRIGSGRSGSGRQKNVTLSFLSRLVVVDPDTLPTRIIQDLDGPICDWAGNPIK